eukprot:CAMPEP_0203903648 /NCGR_PEP_ID=MMETSP0359-20131031/45565_1 /ASSEMBLY_ACC=CAM_ASM_000338 /TAXON_ID=268821 /ORGANISM="Scrippsiella Hangoei, Strain SHTV-5" /LENGTH=148 /DNA_ID=CAMNT_0050827735 /DNA_START=53 /DNA_END=498 /DNA_ORIENTATION=-
MASQKPSGEIDSSWECTTATAVLLHERHGHKFAARSPGVGVGALGPGPASPPPWSTRTQSSSMSGTGTGLSPVTRGGSSSAGAGTSEPAPVGHSHAVLASPRQEMRAAAWAAHNTAKAEAAAHAGGAPQQRTQRVCVRAHACGVGCTQ